MPVVLSLADVHHVADGDSLLLRLVGQDAEALGYNHKMVAVEEGGDFICVGIRGRNEYGRRIRRL